MVGGHEIYAWLVPKDVTIQHSLLERNTVPGVETKTMCSFSNVYYSMQMGREVCI